MSPTSRWTNLSDKLKSLSSLQTVISKRLKNWDYCLPYVEFTYDISVHIATKHSPFEAGYGFNPITPLDLAPLPIKEQLCMDSK